MSLLVSLIDTPTIDNISSGEHQTLRYQYSNHLGSATLELADDGDVISYEEYYPYGTTSFQSGRSTAETSLKRYRFAAAERDDESGLYYMGARYYIPWLARWCAVDPLESKYAPQSSYVYCSNNPIKKIDPSGMGEEDNNRIQFKGGNNFPLEENYAPVSSTHEMPWNEDYTFVSKFGEDVTRYHDDALNRDYSVMRRADATGHERLFSWVDLKTGKAGLYTGDNKNAKGEWTGHWVEFESAEKRNVRLANETADAITKGFIATGVGLFALPVGLEFGLFSLTGSISSGVIGSTANFTGQYLTVEGDNSIEKLKNINVTDVIVSGIFKNPITTEFFSQSFEFSYNNGLSQSVFGLKTWSEVGINTAIAGSVDNVLGFVGSNLKGKDIFSSEFSSMRDLRSFMGKRWSTKLYIGVTDFSMSTSSEAASNKIQDQIK